MTQTFDNKRLIKPLRLEDIDIAFWNWFQNKLDLHIATDDGTKKKVNVLTVSPERWSMARQEGVRDENGTIVLPIIAIGRTKVGGPNEGPFGRIIADIKAPFTYAKRVNSKSSLLKELIQSQGKNGRKGWEVDPSLPIYEIFTSNVADHMMVTYEVSIWCQYIREMNEIIEKIGQKYDYLSVKSFSFETPDNYYFVAFQDDELTDESNMDEYTDSERIIRRSFVFNVPAYIIPEPNDQKSNFRRYLSQSRLIIKQETALTNAEYEELINK